MTTQHTDNTNLTNLTHTTQTTQYLTYNAISSSLDKKLYEKIKVNQIVDNWDLNRISESELTVVKKLASGGQGKVKLGKYYDMSVIIKVLHDLNARDYTNEVVNMFKYRHPNIPKFLGIFDSDKDFGVVIEHVDGMTMSKIIQMEKQGKLNIPFLTKIDYLIQLASVIDYLHDNHLIHRDLKPGNIIIDHLGNLMLLDFGIAIPESKNEIDMDTHDFCLTPSYIPPEVAEQANKIGEEEDKSSSDSEGESEEEISRTHDMCNNNKISSQKSEHSTTSTIITSKYMRKKQPKRKIIIITNKCDVWTFGLIMCDLFTRCGPWARTEKDKVLDYTISKYILLKKPYPICKIIPEGNCNESKVREIIKKCTHYNPDLRASIKEVKNSLLEIFHNEVIESGKKFKYSIMKNLNQVHREVRQTFDKNTDDTSKRQIMRNNKMLYQRKNYSIESINKVNLQLNVTKLGNQNLDSHVSSDLKVIFSEHMKLLSIVASPNSNSESKNLFEIDNSLLEGLKKINMQRGQKKVILEHKKRELEGKLEDLNRRFGKSNLNSNSKDINSSSVLKTFYYMNYDEFNGQILVYEFPKRELKTVELAIINRNLNYRNPFCLNYDDKLFLIGGLVINSGIKVESELMNRRMSMINYHREYFGEIFGTNYLPTNYCFYFDPSRKEQKILPYLLYPRSNHSCIVFRKTQLWVIGGDTKACEVLDIRNINTTKFERTSFRTFADLVDEMFNPVLMTYNDNYILALEYEQRSELEAGESPLKSNVKFQVYNWHTKIWSVERVALEKKVNIEYFSGGYHNQDREDNLLIFANYYLEVDKESQECILEEGNQSSNSEDNKEEHLNRNDNLANMTVSTLLKFKVSMEGNDKEPKFSFSLQDLKELNLINFKHTAEFLNEARELQIHNSNTIYEYDEDFYYFTVKVDKKEITLRSIDSDQNDLH